MRQRIRRVLQYLTFLKYPITQADVDDLQDRREYNR